MVGVPAHDRLPYVLAQRRMARKLAERRTAAGELVTAGGVEPGQHADRRAILAGNDGVLQRRRGGGERADAQHTDRDPGAGGELEVLGQTSVENDALPRIGGGGQTPGGTPPLETRLLQ